MNQNKSFRVYVGNENQPTRGIKDSTKGITDQVNNISLRLRMLEEHYSNLRKKTQVIDKNMLTISKKNNKEIKAIDMSLNELKLDLGDTREKTE